jgi:hypothetical protein
MLILLMIMPLGASRAVGAARVAGGTCDDDCKNEYVSALGECRSQYEKGEENLEDLESCLADTRGEYDDCVDACNSMGAGGVVACKSGPAAITLASMPLPSSASAPLFRGLGGPPSAMLTHISGR